MNLFNNEGFNKSFNYQYNKLGYISSINNISYEYDEAGQLTRVNDPVYGTTVYQYDKVGNIRSVNTYVYTLDQNPGIAISTVTYSYDNAWKDLLTSYNGHEITYDTIGNPIYYRNTGYRFEWEMGRQLSKVYDYNGTRNNTNDDTLNYSYTYDDNGLRLSKTDHTAQNPITTIYSWVGRNITHQNDGTREIYFRYDSDGSLVGFELTENNVTTEYYYVKNIQGDVIAILDSTGALLVEYEYDAWGKPLSIKDGLGNDISADLTHIGNLNPYRYRGYYYDVEDGIVLCMQ